ncbi:MAG: enoyl-CoA hydratase/isomerase family protein, partial [Gammaproteobacteria bacterium]|nr:enoyl-CoA hydratase/isomerase family protein [Gammaproteobacteria bacterium]
MSTMQLELKEQIHVLTLTNHDNENTFNLEVMHEYLAAFDAVEQYSG